MGRASKELHKHKPNSSLVKGKKEYTRSRAVLFNPISAASDKAYPTTAASNKISLSTHADWSTSISKLCPEICGEFIFGANPNINMGDQLGRVDYGDAESDY